MSNNGYESVQGMSFRQLLTLVKKSLPIMIVSVLIVSIISSILIFVAKSNSTVVRSAISYDYAGGNLGMTPDGNVLDFSLLKSDAVLKTSLEACGFVITVDELRPHVNMLSEKNPKNEYSYTLVLQDCKKLGLSNAQATTLMNQILLNYFGEFARTYRVDLKDETLLSDTLMTDNDYILSCNIINNKMIAMSSILENLKKYTGFVSTTYNIGFAELDVEIKNVMSNSFAKLEGYVLSNRFTKNKTELDSYFSHLLTKIGNMIKQNDNRATALATALKSFSTTNVSLAAAYQEMFAEYNAVLTTISDLKTQESFLLNAKTEMDKPASGLPTDVMLAETTRLYQAVNADLNGCIAKLNKMQSEHIVNLRSTQTVSSKDVYLANDGFSIKFCLVVLFIALLLTAVLSIATTNIILKNNVKNNLVLAKSKTEETAINTSAENETEKMQK